MFGSPKLVKIEDQTLYQKMRVLSLEVTPLLGSAWDFYQKIRYSSDGFSFFKEKSLLEEMKATKSALTYTSRNTNKLYRANYQTTIREIKKYQGKEAVEELPELPEVDSSKEIPPFPPECDGPMIGWTPVKFLTPAGQIREKGKATQRHTESLIAKLYFKVVAYYSIPEHWDSSKLAFYLDKVNPDMEYKDIVSQLEPLKKDLNQFLNIYAPFLFGRSKRSTKEKDQGDVFDDYTKETEEQEVVTLYLYDFIYRGLENFFFHYYLTLVSASRSTAATKYLSSIFEPVLYKLIEQRILFEGSFETDRSKRALRDLFNEHKKKRAEEEDIHVIDGKKHNYESYSYTLEFLEKRSIPCDPPNSINGHSEWSAFLKKNILTPYIDAPIHDGKVLEDDDFWEKGAESGEKEGETVEELKLRKEFALLQILAMMVKCHEYTTSSKRKVLENFKNVVKADRDLVVNRITELRRNAEKQIRVKKRKITKLKSMKQFEAIEVYQKDIDEFLLDVNQRCKSLEGDARKHLQVQKKRMLLLLEEIKLEKKKNDGESSKVVLDLSSKLTEERFLKEFTGFVVRNIIESYNDNLEGFYKNVFYILEPDIKDKVSIIQALEKSGGADGIKLELDSEEKEQLDNSLKILRAKINSSVKGIFQAKIVLGSVLVPIQDLLELSIDLHSFKMILHSKVSFPQKAAMKLSSEIVKSLLILNSIQNAVPKNNIVLEGRENEKDPMKGVNISLLNRLIAEVQTKKMNSELMKGVD